MENNKKEKLNGGKANVISRFSDMSIHKLYRLKAQYLKLVCTLPNNPRQYDIMDKVYELINAEIEAKKNGL